MKKTLPLAALLLALASPISGQEESSVRRLLLTVADPAGRDEPLMAVEVDLRVDKKPADILRLYQPEERPVELALLIADDAGPEVAQSLPALADFLRSLPAGSQVLVAYGRRGALDLVQEWTPASAGVFLRAPSGLAGAGPANLGQLFTDLLAQFPDPTSGRAQILYVGEGSGSDPYHDVTLNRAIAQAQERGIAVWAIHASGPLGEETTGEGSHALAEAYLKRASEESGGRSFALGLHPPALDPYLKELRALLNRQYLVEFVPPAGSTAGALRVRLRRRPLRLLYPQH